MVKSKLPPDQLNLFGAVEMPVAPKVGPAQVDPEDTLSAEALHPSIRLGTSSWSFPGWEGIVYDRKVSQKNLSAEGLQAYASHPLLRTVGIDRSYYAPVPIDDFRAYAAQVPEHFRFLVKAGQTVVSPREPYGRGRNPLFLNSEWAKDYVVRPAAQGLGNKLGVILFQFPPMVVGSIGGPHGFVERLEKFLGDLPSEVKYAVELRNAEFLTRSYRDVLQKFRVDHCYNVHPTMPTLERQLRVLPLENNHQLVVRWMLREGLSFESAGKRYAPFNKLLDQDVDVRLTLSALLSRSIKLGKAGLVIVNNKAEGSSPLSIFALARMLR